MEKAQQSCPSLGQDRPATLKRCLVGQPDERNCFVEHQVLQGKWRTCFTLEGVIGPEECLNLIRAAQTSGYCKAVAGYPPSYRNNSRLVVDDVQLAEELFHRIRRQIPDPLVDENGVRWRPIGINERFRFCCYGPGQFFKIHRDGVFHRSAHQCSRLTFMVYLNSSLEFEGGATRFFPSSNSAGTPLASIAPQSGTLIVFDHSLWHDGERVTSGMKYIMRSDILYELEVVNQNTRAETQNTHSGYVWSVAELTDKSVASGGRDKTIRIWRRDGAALACQQVLRGHTNSITALSTFGADDLWSGSRDHTVRIWQRREGTFCCAATINAHDGAVLCLTKLEDGRMASGGADGIIRLWSQDGRCIKQLTGDGSWVWDIKSLDRETLISASENGTMSLWRLAEDKCLTTINTDDGSPIRSLALLRKGEFVASGSANGIVRIWQMAKANERVSAQVVQRLEGHTADVCALVELPDGRLATGAEDNLVLIRSFSSGVVQKTFCHDDYVTALAVLSDGKLMSASYDGTIKIWPELAAG
jgi:WD40 repeat protein